MNILITICARGGSKGIPGKNIKELNGKPLIAYTIEVANRFKNKYGSVDVALSTDSDEIIRVASSWGVDSEYKRPTSLGGDTVGKIEAIKDVVFFYEAKNNKEYDYILDLDVTSPLRNLDDLTNAFTLLLEDENAVNLFSVSPSGRSPYFNMVEQKQNGYFAQVKKPDGNVFTRQSVPVVYDLNASFYFYRRVFFDQGYRGAITDKSLIYLVPHTCFDLDHPVDFDILAYLLASKKLNFAL